MIQVHLVATVQQPHLWGGGIGSGADAKLVRLDLTECGDARIEGLTLRRRLGRGFVRGLFGRLVRRLFRRFGGRLVRRLFRRFGGRLVRRLGGGFAHSHDEPQECGGIGSGKRTVPIDVGGQQGILTEGGKAHDMAKDGGGIGRGSRTVSVHIPQRIRKGKRQRTECKDQTQNGCKKSFHATPPMCIPTHCIMHAKGIQGKRKDSARILQGNGR